MEKLYEEIENLKNIIDRKNVEIKILKEEIENLNLKNDIFKNVIKNNNINYDSEKDVNNLNIGHSDDLLSNKSSIFNVLNSYEKKIKKLEKENITNNIKDVVKGFFNVSCLYNIVDTIIYNNDKLSIMRVNYNDILKLTIKDKYIYTNDNIKNIKLITYNLPIDKNSDNSCYYANNIKTKKIRRDRDNSLNAIERYPVKVYEKTNSELLQFVSEENKFKIKYQYKIAEKLDKKIEDISINDIINFKIRYEGLKDNKDQRSRLKRKIERCKFLYETYGEKLGRFKISLNSLADMTENIWNEWKIEFDIKVNNLYKESIKCGHKYKNDKICNKYDCKINHKPNI